MIAIEEVELLVLEKSDFQRILAKSVDHEANEKFRFVSDLPFFLNSSTREIQRLSAIMTKKTFEAKKCTCTRLCPVVFIWFEKQSSHCSLHA